MILLVGSPNLNAFPPVLPDASHRAPDREREASPPGAGSAWWMLSALRRIDRRPAFALT